MKNKVWVLFTIAIVSFLLGGFIVFKLDKATVQAVHPLVLPATFPTPTPTYLQLINEARMKDGEATLSANQQLNESAKTKACDMLTRNYFEHVSPGGTTPWDFIHDTGYNYNYAGENLAEGYDSNIAAMLALMNSPEHRENILNPHFTEVGIGECGIFVVQHFASPQ